MGFCIVVVFIFIGWKIIVSAYVSCASLVSCHFRPQNDIASELRKHTYNTEFHDFLVIKGVIVFVFFIYYSVNIYIIFFLKNELFESRVRIANLKLMTINVYRNIMNRKAFKQKWISNWRLIEYSKKNVLYPLCKNDSSRITDYILELLFFFFMHLRPFVRSIEIDSFVFVSDNWNGGCSWARWLVLLTADQANQHTTHNCDCL